MSNLRLKPGKNFVPQGMPFRDPRTGRLFDAYQYSVDGVITMIIEHRQNHPKHYPPNETQWFMPTLVRQEFLRHIKLIDPRLLADGGDAAPNPPVQSGAPTQCTCGGTAFSPEYCPTCGNGKRIIGYKCDKCGKVKAV